MTCVLFAAVTLSRSLAGEEQTTGFEGVQLAMEIVHVFSEPLVYIPVVSPNGPPRRADWENLMGEAGSARLHH